MGFVADEEVKSGGFQPDPVEAQPSPRLQALLRGLPGGPMGVAASLAGQGVAEGSEALTKGAYDLGGRVTDVASKFLPPEVAAGLGFTANVGTQSLPMIFGGAAAKPLGAPAMEGAARFLMRSAAKPQLSDLKGGDVAKAIDTMLKEGINVSGGGVLKLRKLISDLNQQVSQAIQSSPATVDKSKVAQELHRSLNKFEKQVNPSADVKAIENAWTEFVNHPLISGNKIPVQQAQEMKQATYSVLRNKYGQLGSAETEAQKDLARGLKKGIEEAVPSVKGLNTKESELIDALDIVERRALLELNKNPAGLAILANNKAAATAFMADRSALFKSLLGRMLYAGKEQVPATAARAGIGTYTLEQASP